MEVNEKLKQLRNEKGWTQEQLAEKLFVSRTAVSKWESGRGYPNIESLKSISRLYGVSIDDLLSNEELLIVAETETQGDRLSMLNLMYASLDILLFLGMFLPLYGQNGQTVGTVIHMVSLVQYQNPMTSKGLISFSVFLIMGILGLLELIIYFLKKHSFMKQGKIVSLSIHALAILLFSQAHIPYATAYLFMLFIIKIALLLKTNTT
ncbi:helix-turn-helix domain-containing protein [Enterococcus sp. BWR-S5]|uniref:helix-turn-helix domain-containing protein n=1 Tax=Enterococcus sp. BWR-S5 TaxID=2787714 RepID=UPI001923B298|nr:helix-turn-helix transcriptional regulator [Enterococcus sp. BWR-S5]MBL1225739.1 helix-turn-helix transcriptional regulator [Enterococcus sp. BWR-S5]